MNVLFQDTAITRKAVVSPDVLTSCENGVQWLLILLISPHVEEWWSC